MRRLLETNPDLEVAAVCEDLDSLLAAVEPSGPMSSSPTSACRRATSTKGFGLQTGYASSIRTSAWSCSASTWSPPTRFALFEGGTERRAYLLKERVHDVGQLVAAIRAVAEGGSVVDPKVVEALVAEKTRREHSPLNELTPRERDVLREMAEGKNNAAIAEALRPERAHGREGDPRDLPQARPCLGSHRPQACEGGDLLPERDCRGDTAGGKVELTADRGDVARARARARRP